MRRRDFISLLGGAAAWPRAARAQQQAMPVIGFLSPFSAEASRALVAEFYQGLKEAGYVDGQNVAIEFRWANYQPVLPRLAADLVERRVNVIVVSGSVRAALAAKFATSTIPIVFAAGYDPVKYGLVTSLNRPGGNITGLTFLANEIAGKRLDLLSKLVPQVTRFGYLVGDQRAETERELTGALLSAGRALGRQVIVLECRNVSDFEPAFSTLVQRQAGALVVGSFPLAFNNRAKILALAARHEIPAIYAQGQYAYEGGLMSYSGVGVRQIAFYYVRQILKGAKPADLPVQQPTKFEFVINLKIAKALGLTIPETLLATADKVIE
jgi:putative ABC transport system substrate-binding protein